MENRLSVSSPLPKDHEMLPGRDRISGARRDASPLVVSPFAPFGRNPNQRSAVKTPGVFPSSMHTYTHLARAFPRERILALGGLILVLSSRCHDRESRNSLRR